MCKSEDAQVAQVADVRLVGFGVPKRSMAWYHAKQLLEGRVQDARLTAIVSPTGAVPGSALQEWSAGQSCVQDGSCKLHAKVTDMEPATPASVAIIACRTADMPQRVREVVDHGIKFVYLEKPGAPSPAELEELAKFADERGAKIFLGYNKNVADFVSEARKVQADTPHAHVLFEHNNTFLAEELDECFERNSEGMLKNMAIHELMLAVTYKGMSVANLKSVAVDKDFSRCETRKGFTDFPRVQFTLTTADGASMTVKADRCGGHTSRAVITASGKELFSSTMPNPEDEKRVAELDAAMPGVTAYLHVQDGQYLLFKERLCAHALGGPAPEGMPTIWQGVEALRLAEHLTPLITSELQTLPSPSQRQQRSDGRCGIALIGSGRMGQLRAEHIYANPRAELVCVIDPMLASAKRLADRFHCACYASLEEALQADSGRGRISAVWLSTPTFTHDECIRAAAAAKKPIFTEKPVAESPAEITSLFECCEAAGVPLACGFQRRFDASYVAMKEKVAAGAVGRIMFINVMFGDHPAPPMEFLTKGGCPFMDLVPHDADFIRWLLNGEEPTEVYATGSSSCRELEAAKVCDNATMVAKFPCGAVANICLSRGATYGYDNRIEVFGTEGRLVVETPSETSLTSCDAGGIHAAKLQYSFPQRFCQAFAAEVDLFVRVCLGDEGAVWPIAKEDCIAAQQIAMTAQAANREGKLLPYPSA